MVSNSSEPGTIIFPTVISTLLSRMNCSGIGVKHTTAMVLNIPQLSCSSLSNSAVLEPC